MFDELTKKWTSSRIVLIDHSMSSAALNAYGDNVEEAAGRTLFSCWEGMNARMVREPQTRYAVNE